MLIQKGEHGQIGHASYMNKNGFWVDDPNSNNNDCVYTALSSIIKNTQNVDKSASDLRNETADCITKNPLSYSQVIAAETWIQERYPQEATHILMTAGLNINNGRIGLDKGDVDKLMLCMQKPVAMEKSQDKKRGQPFAKDFKVRFINYR